MQIFNRKLYREQRNSRSLPGLFIQVSQHKQNEMNRDGIIYSFILSFLTTSIHAQQILSPLEASFQTYRQMKKGTKYKLDWVLLGPVVNSARADVVALAEIGDADDAA